MALEALIEPEPACELFVPETATRDETSTLPHPEGTLIWGGPGSGMDALCSVLETSEGSTPRMHGPAVWFHRSGRVKSQGRYVQHKREGVWVEWDEHGHKRAVTQYREDEPDGLCITYWPNGQRQRQTAYRAGKRHGLSAAWNEDGSALEVTCYADDEVVETTTFTKP